MNPPPYAQGPRRGPPFFSAERFYHGQRQRNDSATCRDDGWMLALGRFLWGVSESEHSATPAVIEACAPSHIIEELFLGPLMASGQNPSCNIRRHSSGLAAPELSNCFQSAQTIAVKSNILFPNQLLTQLTIVVPDTRVPTARGRLQCRRPKVAVARSGQDGAL